MTKQELIDKLFDVRWKQVPAYAYDLELRDLFQNFYEMGWRDHETTQRDVADQ